MKPHHRKKRQKYEIFLIYFFGFEEKKLCKIKKIWKKAWKWIIHAIDNGQKNLLKNFEQKNV